jgi:hypothetical protein
MRDRPIAPQPEVAALDSIMAAGSEDYLAVLKASYSYEKQGDDEVTMEEGQLLLLVERPDAESAFLPKCSVLVLTYVILAGGR